MRQIDGKYKTDGVISKNDGTALPEDEPLILFRGQDKLLPQLLEYYNQLCAQSGSPQAQIQAIQERLGAIKKWQVDHPERVKVPD